MEKYTVQEMKQLMKLYFIMGSNNSKLPPEEVLTQALKGGITMFQFREKGENALVGSAKKELAKKLQQLCKSYKVPFIVNDDVDLAVELNADGVHIGQDDETAHSVREKIGDKILGVSAHSLAEVETAILAGADYIGIGPIYPTNTKKDAKEVRGTILIKDVRRQNTDIPIVGIGGITEANATPVMEAGGDGVALISEISASNNPQLQTERVLAAVSNHSEKNKVFSEN